MSKRISHIAVSEMARATILPSERLIGAGEFRGVDVLERIIGKNDLMSITFLDLAVRVARTVGRVQIGDAAGQLVGYGTGFMIGPRVMITNNHVLDSAASAASSQVEFNYQDTISGLAPTTELFELDPGSLFLTDEALDYTLVAVRERSASVELSSFGYNRLVEQEGKVLRRGVAEHHSAPERRAESSFALRENRLIDVLRQIPPLPHRHRTRILSGSPVFNDQWEVVALHHSGVPRTDAQGRYLTKDRTIWSARRWASTGCGWIANEGARISQIVLAPQERERSERDGAESPRRHPRTQVSHRDAFEERQRAGTRFADVQRCPDHRVGRNRHLDASRADQCESG